jgi:phosphomannomutase/phosphoglucomutase
MGRVAVNPQIFREYDIRGVVGEDLTEPVVEELGKAYGTMLADRVQGPGKVSVGYDVRPSSEGLAAALTRGILSTGVDVVNIGLVPTPVLYFSLFHLDVAGGMMVTGSHNPPEFNGFKVAIGKTTIYGEEIKALGEIIAEGAYKKGQGRLSSQDVLQTYIQEVKARVGPFARPIKVVADAGNGCGGLTAPRILRDLGADLVELYTKPDGTFPHHHPDPTIVANMQDLINTVRTEKAEMGVAYDGDADRLGVVDDQGNIIWGDQLMILFSREVLQKRPGAPIIFEVKCSQALVEEIEKHGGQPIMWRTGHSLIKEKMKEEGAPLAGEMSGHLFFADEYFGYDDAVYASCRLIRIRAASEQSISQMLADVPKYYSTPEIRVDCPDEEKFKVVTEIATYFKKHYKVIDVDGVRVLFGDGWGLVRASNTQPALVVRFEARTPERLAEIKKVMADRLAEISPVRLPE